MIRLVMRVPWRLALLAVVLACWLLAELAGIRGIDRSPAYFYATSLLLAIGLYGSTYGIDLALAREHHRLIVTAVTVGVLLKAAIIGGVLLLATGDPLFLLLGVAVAQIDPLSVAAILGHDRLSGRVKAILASWASFDDPLTVILVVYATALATGTFGLGIADGTSGAGVVGGIADYGLDLLANLGFAALVALAWSVLRGRRTVLGVVLALLALLAVWQFLMLGVALAGLIVRPAWLARAIGPVTQGALVVAAALLGLLLVNGLSLFYGSLLGIMAFAAQAVVGMALSRGLNRTDRVHLALAQQNGITAIILGLRLEAQFNGVVAIIAPAILVTNVTHLVANWFADWVTGRRRPVSGLPSEPVRSAPDATPAPAAARAGREVEPPVDGARPAEEVRTAEAESRAILDELRRTQVGRRRERER